MGSRRSAGTDSHGMMDQWRASSRLMSETTRIIPIFTVSVSQPHTHVIGMNCRCAALRMRLTCNAAAVIANVPSGCRSSSFLPVAVGSTPRLEKWGRYPAPCSIGEVAGPRQNLNVEGSGRTGAADKKNSPRYEEKSTNRGPLIVNRMATII